jgi:hypothetical protein
MPTIGENLQTRISFGVATLVSKKVRASCSNEQTSDKHGNASVQEGLTSW